MASSPDNPISARLTYRPVSAPADEEFLRGLYLNSRDDLSGVLPDNEQMRHLLMIQFNAQSISYAQQFPDAVYEIVELDGSAIGRVIVDRSADRIHVVDISLMPTVRNLGVGTQVLKRILDECQATDRPCSLQVVRTNIAQRLYARLGFQIVDDDGMRLFMKWRPSLLEE